MREDFGKQGVDGVYPVLLYFAALPLPGFAQEKSGAQVYEAVCSECHGSGKDNAPPFGDKKRWGKLVREVFWVNHS